MKRLLIVPLIIFALAASAAPTDVRIKHLGRIEGVRDNALVGYGLVTGLAGTGDTARSRATVQSVANMLLHFGVNVSAEQINSRNVAAVMVTATLPPFARSGDRLSVNVSSLGDARSLLGGTLLMTPLKGPDERTYVLAQGPLSVGGFKYDFNGNVVQKNHPTAGIVPDGGIVENVVATQIVKPEGVVNFILNEADFTTANRVAAAVNTALGQELARPLDAARIQVQVPETARQNLVGFITQLENTAIVPDLRAKVVVNERTGTVVAGGDVRLSEVTVVHGDLKVAISTEFLISQPSFVYRTGPGVRTAVVPQTQIDVDEGSPPGAVSLPQGATVADLVAALNAIRTSARDIISILQSIKQAGALHADLIIQ